MSATTLRQWQMLQAIPRYPQKIDTVSLQTKLQESGYDINLRTIQRDLNNLSGVLPIIADNAKPQGWSWIKDAPILSIPALNPQTALTFNLLENYMRQLLPTNTLDYLQPWFKHAQGVLDEQKSELARWPDKIRVLPRGMTTLSPTISPNVSETVYQALLEERQLIISYPNKKDRADTKTHQIHPIAIVVRDKVIYLVARFDGYKDVRQLAIHRITSAQTLDAPAQRPHDFNIDQYIQTGAFGMPSCNEVIKLEAQFMKHLAIHLEESPLSEDQNLEEIAGEDDVLLRATVPNTFELRQWLKSFGDEVMVLSPYSLMEEFKEMAENIYEYYNN